MGFLERKREERRIRKRVDALVHENERDAAEGQAAVARHGELLKEHYREIEASPIDEYFQACIVYSTNAAVVCLMKLGLAAAFDFEDDVLNDALQRNVRDDEAWWRACSLLRWGYLSEFVCVNWPDQYNDVMAVAGIAVAPDHAESEVIEYGPLAADEPERFQMRLLRLLGAALAADGDDATELTMHLTHAWQSPWAKGWEQFDADLERRYPDGPPSDNE